MRLLFTLLFFISSTLLFFPQSKGHLVIIGGGERTDTIMKEIITLAGGNDAKVMIIPNASSIPFEVGAEQKEEFQKLGCRNTGFIVLDSTLVNSDEVIGKFDTVNCVFFSGGDQSNLTRVLNNSKLLTRIKEIYNNGGVVSGTSAGAAVMSELMLTGNELINKDSSASFISIQEKNIEIKQGFGFITTAIIDQHFIKRKRLNRLISLIIENPSLHGIGIDESTAIIVKPDNTFEVLGENQVIVFDATGAKNINRDVNGNLGAEGIKMHILTSGSKFNLLTAEVVK
ncbi:MAG TPA: cyanophycinase [Ignavibacteriaceae bacterium]|nr:cyanophycinase [Ignavibacteriaceae bacterium]